MKEKKMELDRSTGKKMHRKLSNDSEGNWKRKRKMDETIMQNKWKTLKEQEDTI